MSFKPKTTTGAVKNVTKTTAPRPKSFPCRLEKCDKIYTSAFSLKEHQEKVHNILKVRLRRHKTGDDFLKQKYLLAEAKYKNMRSLFFDYTLDAFKMAREVDAVHEKFQHFLRKPVKERIGLEGVDDGVIFSSLLKSHFEDIITSSETNLYEAPGTSKADLEKNLVPPVPTEDESEKVDEISEDDHFETGKRNKK